MSSEMHPQFHKATTIFNETDASWLDEYEVPGLTQPTITIRVPREERSPKRIAAELLKRGGRRPSESEERLLEGAISTEAKVCRMVAATGWYDGRRAFARHDVVLGTSETGEPLLPPDWAGAGLAARLGRRGSVPKAAKFLTRFAKLSSASVLAMGAVFGAPLLALLDRGPFALVLVGPSRFGKSSAQLIAGSILGFGDERHLPSMNASPAGMLAAIRTFNDHAFPLNEVGTLKGKKNEIYVTLRDYTYQLMSGQEIIRHPSWQGDASPLASTFRSIILMSSEHSPDQWAARHGVERDDGEKVRLIGVPLASAGAKSIFDRVPTTVGTKRRKAWTRERFRRLHRAAARLHGELYDAYINHLLAHRDTVGKTVAEHVERFEQKLNIGSRDPIAAAIVTSFGVLFAGIAMAIEAGLLNITRSSAGVSLKALCLASLSSLPDPQQELRKDLRKLRIWAKRNAIDKAHHTGVNSYRSAPGWKVAERGGLRIVIRSKSFAELFRRPTRLSRVLAWLDDQGFLDTTKGGRPTKGRSVEWAQRQIDWPDRSRPRSIVINLPRGFRDLRLL